MLACPSYLCAACRSLTADFGLEEPLWIESLSSGWVMVVKLVCLFSSGFLSLKNLASSQLVNQSIQLQMLSSANRIPCSAVLLLNWRNAIWMWILFLQHPEKWILAFSLQKQKIRGSKKQNGVTWRKGKKCALKIPVSELQLPLPSPCPRLLFLLSRRVKYAEGQNC